MKNKCRQAGLFSIKCFMHTVKVLIQYIIFFYLENILLSFSKSKARYKSLNFISNSFSGTNQGNHLCQQLKRIVHLGNYILIKTYFVFCLTKPQCLNAQPTVHWHKGSWLFWLPRDANWYKTPKATHTKKNLFFFVLEKKQKHSDVKEGETSFVVQKSDSFNSNKWQTCYDLFVSLSPLRCRFFCLSDECSTVVMTTPVGQQGRGGGNGGLSQQLTLTRCRVEAVCRVENIRYHEVRKVEQILLCFTVCCVVARGAIIRWKKNRIICPLLCLTLLIMIVQRVKQKYVPHCVKS